MMRISVLDDRRYDSRGYKQRRGRGATEDLTYFRTSEKMFFLSKIMASENDICQFYIDL